MAAKRKKKDKAGHPVRAMALRVLLWVAAIGAGLGATGVGAVTLWDVIVHRPEFRLDLRALSLGECPEWLDCAMLNRELRRELAELPDEESIFSPTLAHAVQHELRASPWILDLKEVRRVLPDRLAIRAVYREPVGVVRWNGSRHLVDREGHWLPDDLYDRPAEWGEEETPVVVDRLWQGSAPVGAPWNPPRYEVGARLTSVLRQSGLLAELPIATIDVTGVGRQTAEPKITLTTQSGAVIRWGSSSVFDEVEGLQADPSSPTDEQKLAMLRSKLVSYPGLRGVEHIDLRFHSKIYTLPAE
ncbi:MAG: hypothetical protein R6X33_19210 [Candidatus Brocadiia bacterium]